MKDRLNKGEIILLAHRGEGCTNRQQTPDVTGKRLSKRSDPYYQQQILPENSLSAFTHALTHGADGLECDVYLSKDGVPMVIHDDSLARNVDGYHVWTKPDDCQLGKVSDFTMKQLKDEKFSIGNNEVIPTLEELLVLVIEENKIYRNKTGRNLFINIELNSDPAISKAVYDLIMKYLNTDCLFTKKDFLFNSFDKSCLAAMKAMDSEMQCSLNVSTKLLFGPCGENWVPLSHDYIPEAYTLLSDIPNKMGFGIDMVTSDLKEEVVGPLCQAKNVSISISVLRVFQEAKNNGSDEANWSALEREKKEVDKVVAFAKKYKLKVYYKSDNPGKIRAYLNQLAAKEAFDYVNDEKNVFDKNTREKFFSAFDVLLNDQNYVDLMDLNEEDERLLDNRNALTAYCNYIISTQPAESYRYHMVSELIGSALVQAIQKGEAVTLPEQGWWVPSVSILERIKMKPEAEKDPGVVVLSSGRVAKVSDLKYTILDKRIAMRDVCELAELCVATESKEPADLVTFQPHMVALHITQAKTMTEIQLLPKNYPKDPVPFDHEEDLRRIVDLIMEEAKPNIKIHSKQLLEARDKFALDAKAYLLWMKEHPEKTAAECTVNPAVAQFVDASKKNAVPNVTLGEYVKSYTMEDAIINLAVDKYYKKLAEEVMEKVIDKAISDLKNKDLIRALEAPKQPPCLFIISGGPASGKSSSVLALKQQADKHFGGWQTFVKTGVDCLRKHFLDYGNIPLSEIKSDLFSQFTSHEAQLVNYDIVIGNKIQHYANTNKLPNVFIETCFLKKDKIDIFKNHGPIYITMVSTEVLGPHGSIARAYQRGLNIGRFISTKTLLSFHQKSAAQLPGLLTELKGWEVTINIVDNNVSYAELPILATSIDCKTQTILIHDQEKLLSFIKKIALNPKATSLEEAYNTQELASISIEKYFEKLMNDYTITYVQVKSTLTSS